MRMAALNKILSPNIPDYKEFPMDIHPLTLTFRGQCAVLEKPFIQDMVQNALLQIRVTLSLGFVFYALFGILDAIVAPELKLDLWYIRFGLVCPVIAIALAFSFLTFWIRRLQAVLMTAALIAGLGIVYMTFFGNALVASTYYAGLMLILMFIYSFVWARFIWATLCGGLLVVIYIMITAARAEVAPELLFINSFFCVTANLIGMAVCYAFEFYSRRDFYMRRILEEHRKQVEAAKGVLEERVEERTRMLALTNEELRREIGAHQRLSWEKHILEVQLRQAQKMEAIGTLAGGIAHDFNNILAAILGHSELALMQLNNKNEAQICLSEVINASIRAKDLVGQILAFSRQSESELKPLQINLIIKEAMRLLKATLPASITIKQNIKADDSIVIADATQLHQIMINLCTNAAHAMESKGGELVVALEDVEIEQPVSNETMVDPNRPASGQYVCLSISDTGKGIPGNLLERIFDPYFTTKAKGVGTGLGLAVVRGIVQNHGGVIEVNSVPDQGTVFKVYLPRSEGRGLPEIQQLHLLSQGHERIMLVEDDEGLAELGLKLLTTLGYRVTAFTSPEKALNVFREHADAFDLVITDMIMPKLSGEKFAGEVLSLRPDMPIIVYTGFTNLISMEKIKQMGIKAVLRKPITIYNLSQTIRRVLTEHYAAQLRKD